MMRLFRVPKRGFRFEMKIVKVPLLPADPADNVWGFLSSDKSESLLESQKKLFASLDKGHLGSIKDQLSERGYDKRSFEEGCEVAYRRIAELYEAGESVFEDDHSDIVEERLALLLDQQLADYRRQAKVPRLSLQNVEAKILCLMSVPKKPPRHIWTTLLDIFFSNAKWAPTVNHFISTWVHFLNPDWNELLVAVEFTAQEKFELISKEDASQDPPRSYVNEMVQKAKASEQHELVNTINSLRGSVSNVVERKHLFVFSADLAAQAEGLEKGNEADVLEFKLRSIGLPIQLPSGIEFKNVEDEGVRQ